MILAFRRKEKKQIYKHVENLAESSEKIEKEKVSENWKISEEIDRAMPDE